MTLAFHSRTRTYRLRQCEVQALLTLPLEMAKAPFQSKLRCHALGSTSSIGHSESSYSSFKRYTYSLPVDTGGACNLFATTPFDEQWSWWSAN